MRNLKRVCFSILLFLSITGTAYSTCYVFEPNPKDLYDLDHFKAYKWGINWSLPTGEQITEASLFFDNIRNWKTEPNTLWVHLLNSPPADVSIYYDSQNSSDFFDGRGILLNKWENLPALAQDLSYNFDSSELNMLASYASDGRFGFGFDPDCHFYNDGIKLKIKTAAVPEPATLLLLGIGLVGLTGYSRRKYKTE